MISYIIRFAVLMAVFLPVYILVRRPWRSKGAREWQLMLFWLITFALLTLALEGDWRAPGEMLSDAVRRLRTGESINFVPLRTVSGFFADFDPDRFLVNIVGNIIMFMPWGFGLVQLWESNRKPLRVAGLSLAITLFIESCQLFIGRAVDIDDLILNFLGSVLGALVWLLIRRASQPQKAPHEV